MRAFDSSIGRLAIAVLTAAIGLEAMRSQSEFWLGVLATLAAAWVAYALATAVAERGRRRASCLAFAAGSVACLAACSGPWSDVSFRGDLSDPQAVQRTVDDGLFTTRALLRFASRYVKPRERATIVLLDQGGQPYMEMALANRRGRSGEGGDLAHLTEEMETATRVHIGFFSSFRSDFATQIRTRFQTLDVYFHAAYLLLSLALGALAGCVALLFRRTPSVEAERPDL